MIRERMKTVSCICLISKRSMYFDEAEIDRLNNGFEEVLCRAMLFVRPTVGR